jgi:ribose 5-phosphate isomerase A
VAALGKFPLPVEVIPFAETVVARQISALGAKVALRKTEQGSPFTTDERHHILDCSFEKINHPASLAATLSAIPGVVEHGLFINMATLVLVAKGSKVTELRAL